ncbi:MAG: carbon-nitrogen hydrolase family protein [Armatimonadetes bacterium]|nr:carbon-nitrogen hydrolase family protein [Armatimonadota bacterium]
MNSGRFKVVLIAIALCLMAGATSWCADAKAPTSADNKRSVRVACLPIRSVSGNLELNYRRAERVIEQIFEKKIKPDIIILPEIFGSGYYPSTDLRPYAEDRDSKYLQRLRGLSKKGDCMIIVGFLLKVENGIKNSAVIYDRGVELGIHSKSSLFVSKTDPRSDEVTLLVPGDGIEVWDTRFGKFAVLLCYENIAPEDNWSKVASRVDYILSLYDHGGDPVDINIGKSKQHGKPSAWTNATGTAGGTDTKGNVIAYCRLKSTQEIVGGDLAIFADLKF